MQPITCGNSVKVFQFHGKTIDLATLFLTMNSEVVNSSRYLFKSFPYLLNLIFISLFFQCIGYSLAFVFCIIAIIIVTANDCNRGRNSACCRNAAPENEGEVRRDLLADLHKKQSVQHEMGKLQDDGSRHRHSSQVVEIEEKV